MFIILVKFLLCGFFGCILFLFLDFVYYLIKFREKKRTSEKVIFKQSSFLYNLFFRLPRLLALEVLSQDVNEFKDTGLILFEGQQGAGKTMAMTHYCNLLKARYPDLLIATNYNLLFEDFNLDTWQPIVGNLNGHSGLVACFDEISLWFSNRNYMSFPPEFLRTIVQNRKEHRLILGTCQQINMVDKQIRRQCTEVRKCRTFFGVVTCVWKFRPIFSGDGEIIKLINKGFYLFLQEEDLRYQYDTFKVVENLGKVGFNERQQTL